MSTAEILHDVRVVVFDVGETLIDETRMWTAHARSVGVTPFTPMGLIGALIERGHDHRTAWTILGIDPPTACSPVWPEDCYPDALDCLRRVKDAGLKVGIAGNQPHAPSPSSTLSASRRTSLRPRPTGTSPSPLRSSSTG